MIYIDPPYNTGNTSFVYADNFRQKSTPGKANGANHAAWLSMMYTRLILARQLLHDDGILFISIDDHEVAHLRLVLDELFGEANFVGQAIWVNRTTPNDAAANFATDHEYIIIYAKNKATCRFRGIAKDLSNYRNKDNDPRGPWIADNPSAASGNESYRFPIINPHTGRQYLPPKGRYWAFAPARVPEWTASGKIVFPKEGTKNFLLKKYQSELRSDLKPMSSVITGFLTGSGTKELKALFDGESPFRFPKPVALIRHLIEQATGAEDTILDFFAGSGTTAHAVLEGNAATNARRRFICIQLPEPNSGKDPALREKYPLVSDVTKARIRKAAALYAPANEGLGNIPCSFYRIAVPDRP
jgi:adenine-specific DNA-methyltransferase